MKNNRFSLGKFAGSLVGRQKGLTAALILLVVAAAVAGLVPPLILGNVVDRLSGKSDVNAIAGTLLGAGLFYPTSFPACLLPISSPIPQETRFPVLPTTWIPWKTSFLRASSAWRRMRLP